MKRIPKKVELEVPEHMVVKIDPMDLEAEIVVPDITYEITAKIGSRCAFKGSILPIPKVLMFYLNHAELTVISALIEDSGMCGESCLSMNELAVRLAMSVPTLTNTFYTLRRIGLVEEKPNGKRGGGKIRRINYEAVQRLNDLMEGESTAVLPRLRRLTRNRKILTLEKDDVRKMYDNKVLPPGHDPAEEEEYD